MKTGFMRHVFLNALGNPGRKVDRALGVRLFRILSSDILAILTNFGSVQWEGDFQGGQKSPLAEVTVI